MAGQFALTGAATLLPREDGMVPLPPGSSTNKRLLDRSNASNVKRQQFAAHGEEDGALIGKAFIVRHLAEGATESDVESVVSPFATTCAPIVTFLTSGEALVELEDAVSADRAAKYLAQHTPHVRGVPISASLSSCTDKDALNAAANNRMPDGLRVLLVTISDLRFAVDIDLMHRLFSPYGHIEKIVTFVKGGVRFQALVQFADALQARDASVALNGKCMYDGCNKIQVQYSKMNQLVVKQNNNRAWDFTVAAATPPPSRTHNLGGTERGARDHVIGGGGGILTMPSPTSEFPPHCGGQMGPTAVIGGFIPASQQPHMLGLPAGTSHGLASHHPAGYSTTTVTTHQLSPSRLTLPPQLLEKLPRDLQDLSQLHRINPSQGCVVICYNLPANEITVEKLFNLLSLYGVIYRIKLLRDKPDTALAQYADPLYATLACYYLHNAPLFGTEQGMQIGISKKAEVKLPPPSSVPTKESAEEAKRTRQFNSRDQRANAEEAEKFIRSACKPTNTLFVANLHESITEDRLRELMSTIGSVTKLEMRPPKPPSKKITAMVEMMSEREALSAICHLHNYLLCESHLKFAFSKQVLGAATKIN